MPCAPQSLLERDQAFDALLGVFMILYEHGPPITIFLLQALRAKIRMWKHNPTSLGSVLWMLNPRSAQESIELELPEPLEASGNYAGAISRDDEMKWGAAGVY
jgi:hypothetical protein